MITPMDAIKKIIIYLSCLFIAIAPFNVSAQSTPFPIGRKWVNCDELSNPYAEPQVYSRVVSDYNIINGKEYSCVGGLNYCKDGSRILKYGYIYIEEKDTVICDNILIFDESWEVGDTTTWLGLGFNEDSLKWLPVHETVVGIGYLNGLKYWDLELYEWKCRWLQGVGYVKGGRGILEEYNRAVGGPTTTVICCTDSNGDTLYVDRDALQLLPTGIRDICAEEISIRQNDRGCTVTLPDNAKWSATLYNSNGTAVARKAGEGCEIILPAENKGTHILVLNIDGKEYTKKVVIK